MLGSGEHSGTAPHASIRKMDTAITLATAVLALVISALTAWLTLFRRGTVRMTQPTVVFFGPDGGRPDRRPLPKVFLRTLLYSTGERGQLLESMYVVLRRQSEQQAFGIWVYGDRDHLLRGSGLYVGKDGVSCNHHFLLRDRSNYQFRAGAHQLEVYAATAHQSKPHRLWSLTIELTEEQAAAIRDDGAGVYFDWDPTTRRFEPHVERRPAAPPALVRPLM
jgi:hypothetical protein